MNREYTTKEYTHSKVVKRYFDPAVDNVNMLHPSLYHYITNEVRRNLIVKYDLEKYRIRQRAKNCPEKASGSWGDRDNVLHINKKFVGLSSANAERVKKLAKRGTVTPEMKGWI